MLWSFLAVLTDVWWIVRCALVSLVRMVCRQGHLLLKGKCYEGNWKASSTDDLHQKAQDAFSQLRTTLFFF